MTGNAETGTVCLVFVISEKNGENGAGHSEGHKEKKLLSVTEQTVRELKLKRGNVSKELFDALEAESNKLRAYRRGLGILGYGANSKKTLERKLKARGFDEESAKEAASKLEKNGYIDEESDAYRIAEREIAKLRGERRIYEKLREKGYERPYSESVTSLVEQTDFANNCAKLIKKKYGSVPAEKKERDKLIAALCRYGYTFSQIKQALTKIQN